MDVFRLRAGGRRGGALPAKHLSGDARLYRLLKELFDWFAALAIGLAALPPVLVLMLLIALRDPGCPLFFQARVGRSDQAIRIAKLRTMRLHSDELSRSLTPEQASEYRREYKLADDPRLIGYRLGGDNERCLGAVLRRYALDELPQLLYNVFLRRDMSLVGPRPVLREELERYYSPEERRLLLSFKPGLTSFWKAFAPGSATYENGGRQRMELYYAAHRGARLDWRILCRTLRSLCSGAAL